MEGDRRGESQMLERPGMKINRLCLLKLPKAGIILDLNRPSFIS